MMFGAVMVVLGAYLLWLIVMPGLGGRAAVLRAGLGLIFLAGISIGTVMMMGSVDPRGTLLLYDDAIEQGWRFGTRRLKRVDIAYKMALNYGVQYLVLILRDKNHNRMTIVPACFVRDHAFDSWMDSIPNRKQ